MQNGTETADVLIKRTADCNVRVTPKGAEALLECLRTRGRNGYAKEDIFYAMLLHPDMVLEGTDGLHISDRDSRRLKLEKPAVPCGGRSIIIRGLADGREFTDIITARELARAIRGEDCD